MQNYLVDETSKIMTAITIGCASLKRLGMYRLWISKASDVVALLSRIYLVFGFLFDASQDNELSQFTIKRVSA